MYLLSVVRYSLSSFFFILLLLFIQTNATAQCVSSFPYNEDFETSDGDWKDSGQSSDWAWGTPVKTIINKAGSGKKCWVTGGLTGNFYNNNEASYLTGPCFDFSNVKQPYLSFDVLWDTEENWDGANLQYTTDNGRNWSAVGSASEPDDCLNKNWYDNGFVNYLSGQSGWSSAKSNNGQWVKASHTLDFLAGQPQVIFRFWFGAGQRFNDYNGFAFDNIFIGEAPLSGQSSFTYACNDANKVTFTPAPSVCITGQQWNFGDPSSGVTNTADGTASASHIFSKAGDYQVTLSGLSNSNSPVSYTLPVSIANIETKIVSPVTCNAGSGVAEAKLSNGEVASAQFYWNTQPETNAATAILTAGYYTITGTMQNGCVNSSSLTLTEPPPLLHSIQSTQPDCSNSNGGIAVEETGGVAPYQYNWSPNISQYSSAGNLAAGNYTIVITDNNFCTDNIAFTLSQLPSNLSHTVETREPDCGGSNGFIQITAAGGSGNYGYEWMPEVSNSSTANAVSAGAYTIIVSDEKQCKDTAAVVLKSKPLSVSLGNDTIVCKGQTLTLETTANYASYLWDDGSMMPRRTVNSEGDYTLQVTNSGGCMAKDTIHVSSGCGDLIFPSGFTPNGDSRNDMYGPTGGFSLVKKYHLLIYNRFGKLIFQTSNPYIKWNGEMSNGIKLSGTYVYLATYEYDGTPKVKKGTITLLL